MSGNPVPRKAKVLDINALFDFPGARRVRHQSTVSREQRRTTKARRKQGAKARAK